MNNFFTGINRAFNFFTTSRTPNAGNQAASQTLETVVTEAASRTLSQVSSINESGHTVFQGAALDEERPSALDEERPSIRDAVHYVDEELEELRNEWSSQPELIAESSSQPTPAQLEASTPVAPLQSLGKSFQAALQIEDWQTAEALIEQMPPNIAAMCKNMLEQKQQPLINLTSEPAALSNFPAEVLDRLDLWLEDEKKKKAQQEAARNIQAQVRGHQTKTMFKQVQIISKRLSAAESLLLKRNATNFVEAILKEDVQTAEGIIQHIPSQHQEEYRKALRAAQQLAEAKAAAINIQALLRTPQPKTQMLTNYPHNRPFGRERPLRITDFSHNTVFHPEFPLNRINRSLQELQALNAFLAQQEETPNSIVGPRALDISNSNSLVRSRPFSTDNINSVSAASVLGRTYDLDVDAVQDGPNQALASGNRETPLMVTDSALNDKIVTKDSQPRSLGQKLGAAVMLSSAVAAATYIKNPEAAQLAVRQAGVALTTVAQRAIPVIGAAWQSLAQGASVRWAHLAPQFRPLIGAAWQSGQAGLRNTAFPLFQSISGALGRGWIQAASSARQIVPAVANHLGHATKAIKK